MEKASSLIYQTFGVIKDPLFIISAKYKCIAANAAFREFMGLPPGNPDEPPPTSTFWPDHKSTPLTPGEFATEFKVASGEVFHVKLRAKALDQDCFLIRIIAGLSKKETLNRFHSQRLETLGMLAGGVAHDFNNILAGILGHITYLKTVLPRKGPHVESLNAIEEGGKKASVVTQQILSFSRLETAEKPVRVNLSDLAARTCILLKGAISPTYSLQCDADPQLCVLGVEGGLAQIIVNLAINARDAMDRSREGSIIVRVKRVVSVDELREVFKGRDLLPKPHVCLSVIDNGQGMTAETMTRIFEPYFSTKKEKGTGLGLATVNAIVKVLGGCVDVQSEVGAGTTVSVYLPEAEEVKASRGAVRPGALTGGTERILVVDDEFPVRNVLCVSLEHLGYSVQVAASGAEALEKFEASKEPFHLVILDMLMPKLSGEMVFARLRELDPKVRVLIISGYTSEEPVRRILESGFSSFIQKPFTIEDLSRKVRECLEAKK